MPSFEQPPHSDPRAPEAERPPSPEELRGELEERLRSIEAAAFERLQAAVSEIRQEAAREADEAMRAFRERMAALPSQSERAQEGSPSMEPAAEAAGETPNEQPAAERQPFSYLSPELRRTYEDLLPTSAEVAAMDRDALADRVQEITKTVYVPWDDERRQAMSAEEVSEQNVIDGLARVFGQNWKDIIEAAGKSDDDFFLPSIMKNLDFALFADLDKAPAPGTPWTEVRIPAIREMLRRLQGLGRKELADKGMVRIDRENLPGLIGNAEKPHWMESDPDDYAATSDLSLDRTFAELLPGKGGFALNGRALQPSVARFYRYVPEGQGGS